MKGAALVDASGTDRCRWLDLGVAVLLGGAAFFLYVRTLAPTLLAGDAGEFQFVPYLLGVAHPTGYPLYCLLGWAWSHLLPLGDVAYRLNLFSAFSAALAVGFLYPTTMVLLRQALPCSSALLRLIAALAAVTLAVTPTLWSQAVMAEVYGLHILIVVLLFYLVLKWAESRVPGMLLAVAGCFGLSLAHHATTLLLAPALLAYLWLTDRSLFRNWRMMLKVSLLLLLSLALYLYIPWRAPQTPYLRLPLAEGRDLVLYDNTLAGLVSFVGGGPFRASLDVPADPGSRLAMTGGLLLGEVGWAGIALALAGVAQLALRRRWTLLALTGLAYAAVVAFNLVYTIGDIYVMYIPSYLVVVLWMAVGVEGLATLFRRQRAIDLVPVALLLALPVWMAARNLAAVDRSHDTGARTWWETRLSEPLPPGAVLISDDRNDIMPMWYLQYVEGKRPDLLGLFPLITPEYPTLGQVLDLALTTGRPVYLIKEMPGIEVKVEVEAEGKLWRVLGPAAREMPDHPLEVRLGRAVALTGYDRVPHSPRPGDGLRVSLYWEALRPLAEYHTYVHLVGAQSQVVAQSDHQPGGVYYGTTLWQPGERLRDDHLLSIPAGTPAGVYRLVAGMYALSDDGVLEPVGDPALLGHVAVRTEVATEPGPLQHAVGADFAGQIELLGYDAASQGDTLTVTLYWRCLQPPDGDYTVFVHLLGPGGETIVQHDGQPQGDSYPTSAWDAGEVVVDEHQLLLPQALPRGDLRLEVGLYLLQSGERLLIEGEGDHVELGPVELGN